MKKEIPNCIYCYFYRHIQFCNLFKNNTSLLRLKDNICGEYGKYFQRRPVPKEELLK